MKSGWAAVSRSRVPFTRQASARSLPGRLVLAVVAAWFLEGCAAAPRNAVPEPVPAPTLSRLEAGVADVLNFVRADPPGFADMLRQTKEHYEGLLHRVSPNELIRTTEGVAAVDEAIAVLESATVAPHVSVVRGLCLAARDHALDQSRTGGVGHDGSDGSQLRDRIERYGTWTGSIAECISYGKGTAAEVVMRLVVDDGVPDRGHRRTILNDVYRQIGVACEPHPSFGAVCVIDFASSIEESRTHEPSSRRRP
jgi:uncharacterized protein YkwD